MRSVIPVVIVGLVSLSLVVCARDGTTTLPARVTQSRPAEPADASPPVSHHDATATRPAATTRPAFTEQDYQRHLDDLRGRVPEGFTIIIEPPFVVVGDEPPARVRMWSQRTVRWAVRHLKQSYFSRDPLEILDIWLFKDEASYRRRTREIFDDRPTTPFGYYSSQHKALIMNIATGGGTLVHEIVHPFMAANFPACPAWFNEGLGSLYEQSSEQGGRIVGLTNWRLAGLQEAIRQNRVPSFAELTAMSDHEFYHLDRGTNYGQARYLCYYLQEKGILRRFYREFVKNHHEDPTGYETLKRVLEVEDMQAFQDRWERFVLGLTFP